ncbi:hypothetical protein EYF80_057764 [Liparis tanakae]|uniref:Macro domain-containing protein n=1 Tax=Liparis tanakae TaxID=230148 RepID=A0A4Z2ETE1_9TELE|nr:hypothetical protein EYF80_057764 [Liparis tanakae]
MQYREPSAPNWAPPAYRDCDATESQQYTKHNPNASQTLPAHTTSPQREIKAAIEGKGQLTLLQARLQDLELEHPCLLVNPTNPNLYHASGVSLEIRRLTGDGMQNESIEELRRNQGPFAQNTVVTTRESDNPLITAVIHTVLVPRQDAATHDPIHALGEAYDATFLHALELIKRGDPNYLIMTPFGDESLNYQAHDSRTAFNLSWEKYG